MTAETTLLAPAEDQDATSEAKPSLAVTIFSKNDCPDCAALKAHFSRKGVPFTEINVQTDVEPRAEFGGKTPLEHVVATHGRQMPAVVVEDGGWGDSWTGRRMDKTMQTFARFRDAGLLIPEEQRTAH